MERYQKKANRTGERVKHQIYHAKMTGALAEWNALQNPDQPQRRKKKTTANILI